MHTQTAGKAIHPLAWVAGIAVILFSAAGIAAIFGWIPTSRGNEDEQVSKATGPVVAASPTRSKEHSTPVQRTPAVPIAKSEPTPVHAAARCSECGVIESVHEIQAKGNGSGIGAVGGAVVGGLLGNQVGGGRGQDVMTVVGAVGGALAGNEVEKRVKSTKSWSITVRLDDGSSRVISETTLPAWRAGDKVKVVNGAIQSNA